MREKIAAAALTLVGLPVWAATAPASIENARIESEASMTPARALDGAGRGETAEWVGWSVPAIPKAHDVCCFTHNFERRGCSLADRDTSWGTSDPSERKDPSEIYVLVERKSARATRVRIVSPSCPVDGAGRRLVWLGSVEAEASLAALSRLIDSAGSQNDIRDPAVAAVAYHLDPRADALIGKRALDRSLDEDAREQAIFWAGNARGATGYRLLDRILSSEPSSDVRQHAVFAVSQSDVPDAVDRIKRAATEDRDSQVRGHSLFCLSQTRAPGVGEWIVARLDAEQDDHVREQAVFALSQLDDGTDWLLQVLRSKRDLETIRRALFWLGQSDDPRALEEIEKILN